MKTQNMSDTIRVSSGSSQMIVFISQEEKSLEVTLQANTELAAG